MGWWEAEKGVILGDSPLDILDHFEEATGWKTRSDMPVGVFNAIAKAYRADLGRGPTDPEMEALLAFHNGDTGLGIFGKTPP